MALSKKEASSSLLIISEDELTILLNNTPSDDPQSAEVFTRFQQLGILPTEELELESAIKLMHLCLFDYSLSTMDYKEELLEFQKNVILATLKQGKEKGWSTLYQLYESYGCPKPNEICDALKDYIKSIFFPQLIRAVAELDRKNPLHKLFFTEWFSSSNYALWLTDKSYVFVMGASLLCQGKSVVDFAALSAHWHAPLQQTVFGQLKTYHEDDQWCSLFQSTEDSLQGNLHQQIEIPEEVIQTKGFRFIARTTPSELQEEGKHLHHCVATYVSQCLFKDTHIISLVNEHGLSASTIELTVCTKRRSVTLCQHKGKDNSDPTILARKAADWLMEGIDSGVIPIDFDHLEAEKSKRNSISSIESKIAKLIGFNPFGSEGLKRCNKAKRVYRQHTPPAFVDNVRQLMQLETVTITFDLPGKKTHTIELNLFNKEEQAKREHKKARINRWTLSEKPSQTEEVEEIKMVTP